jgi:molybdopterin-guanine dinucleotide biosynthesis protein A
MKLADTCKDEFLDIDDDEKYFLNVNNKEDYDKLLKIKI